MWYLQCRRVISFILLTAFLLEVWSPAPARAAGGVNLPLPGQLVALSPAYEPAILKGLKVHRENPFLFDFIVDPGQDAPDDQSLKGQSQQLIKYFLAALAIPPKDVWVNLSPYEQGRIVPAALGRTEMGRDLLAQDYVLKQIAASLTYPEHGVGKEFWNKVYAGGSAASFSMPTNALNKVWIVADRAEIFERNGTALVVKAHLKVMLEEDVVALEKTGTRRTQPSREAGATARTMKEYIIPVLEREVNTGRNFATLRQVFNSIILAAWYRKALREAVLNQVYAGQGNVKGITMGDTAVTTGIYERYLQAYKKGVYNFIKEDVQTGKAVPRKYFAGGVVGEVDPVVVSDEAMVAASIPQRPLMAVEADVSGEESDRAMSATASVRPAKEFTRLDDGFKVRLGNGGHMTLGEVRSRTWDVSLWYSTKGLVASGFTWKGDSPGPVTNDSYAEGQTREGTRLGGGHPEYVFIFRNGQDIFYAGTTDYRRTFGEDDQYRQLLMVKKAEVADAEQDVKDITYLLAVFPELSTMAVASQVKALQSKLDRRGYGDPTFEDIRRMRSVIDAAWHETGGRGSIVGVFSGWNRFRSRDKSWEALVDDPADVRFIRETLQKLDGADVQVSGHLGDLLRSLDLERFAGLYATVNTRAKALMMAYGAGRDGRRSSLRDAGHLIQDELQKWAAKVSQGGGLLPVFVSGGKGYLLRGAAGETDSRFAVYDQDKPLPSGEQAGAAVWLHPSPIMDPKQVAKELSSLVRSLGVPDADLDHAPRLYVSMSRGLELAHTPLEHLLFRLGFEIVEQGREMFMKESGEVAKRRARVPSGHTDDRPVFRYGVYALTRSPEKGIDVLSLPTVALTRVKEDIPSRRESDNGHPWGNLNALLGGEEPASGLRPGVATAVYVKGRPEAAPLEEAFDAGQWLLDYASGLELSGPLDTKVKALREGMKVPMTLWDQGEPYLTFEEGRKVLEAMSSVGLTEEELGILFPPRQQKSQRSLWPYHALNLDDPAFRDQFYRKLILKRPDNHGAFPLSDIYRLIAGSAAEADRDAGRGKVVRGKWEEAVDGLMNDGFIPSVDEFFHINGVDSARSQRFLTERFKGITGVTLSLEDFIHQRVWEQGLVQISAAIDSVKARNEAVTLERTAQELYDTWAYFRTLHTEVAGQVTVGASLQWWIDTFNFGDSAEFNFIPESPAARGEISDQQPAPSSAMREEGNVPAPSTVPAQSPIKPTVAPPQPTPWNKREGQLRQTVVALEQEQGQADIQAVAGRLGISVSQLREELSVNMPGITDYKILTEFRIFVPRQDQRFERTSRMKAKAGDLQYQGFPGELASVLWFFRRLTDEQLQRLEVKNPQEYRQMVETLQWLSTQPDSRVPEDMVSSLKRFMHMPFEFSKLPEPMRAKFKYSALRAATVYDRALDGFRMLWDSYLPVGEKEHHDKNFTALTRVIQRFAAMKGSFGKVTLQELIVDLFKQEMPKEHSALPEPFSTRPSKIRRETVLSFLAELGKVYRERYPEFSKPMSGGVITPVEQILFKDDIYGLGNILFAILSQPSPERYAALLSGLGDEVSSAGLRDWIIARGESLEQWGMRYAYQMDLPRAIAVLNKSNPGRIVSSDDLAAEMEISSPLFMETKKREYPDLGGGEALLRWLREQDPALDNYALLSRYHVYVPSDRARHWDERRVENGAILRYGELFRNVPHFPILMTRAAWLLDQFTDEEIITLGFQSSKDEIRQYREEMAEFRYLVTTKHVDFITRRQLDLLHKADKHVFSFDRLPMRIKESLARGGGIGTSAGIQKYKEVYKIPNYGQAKQKYEEIVLNNMNLFWLYVHIANDRITGKPSLLAESLFSVRPPEESVLARMAFIKEMRDVLRSFITLDAGVTGYFRTMYGSFYGAVEHGSIKNMAEAVTLMGWPLSDRELTHFFSQTSVKALRITPAVYDIFDAAMSTTTPEGGIKLDTEAMALNVRQEGPSSVQVPGSGGMGRLSREALDRLAPVIRSVRPVDVRIWLGLTNPSTPAIVR